MTDREFMEQCWERVEPSVLGLHFGEADGDLHICQDAEIGAAFTRERLEEIRQLREEVGMIKRSLLDPTAFKIERWGLNTFIFARNDYRYRRILSRLQSELARLSAGIKPEALEGKQ